MHACMHNADDDHDDDDHDDDDHDDDHDDGHHHPHQLLLFWGFWK